MELSSTSVLGVSTSVVDVSTSASVEVSSSLVVIVPTSVAVVSPSDVVVSTSVVVVVALVLVVAIKPMSVVFVSTTVFMLSDEAGNIIGMSGTTLGSPVPVSFNDSIKQHRASNSCLTQAWQYFPCTRHEPQPFLRVAVLTKYTVIVMHLSSPLQTCTNVFAMSETEGKKTESMLSLTL